MSEIKDRAREEAEECLAQFERLETLGKFVGEPVHRQKLAFLTLSLVNFARREQAGCSLKPEK